LFTPVVLWNAANHWNSVRHVAHIGGADQTFAIHFNYLADFLGSQAALLSPLVFILTLLAWIHIIRKKRNSQEDWIYRFVFFTSFPVIAGFAALSLHSRVYGNWPCAGYVTTPVLIAALWGRPSVAAAVKVGQSGKRLWRWTIGTSFGLTALLLIHVTLPVLPIPSNLDRTVEETVGWDLLGNRVNEIYGEMAKNGPVFIFGLKYQMASELAFYTPGQPRTVAINRWDRPNVYDYWWQDAQLMSRDAIGVIPDDNAEGRLLEVFQTVDPPESFVIYRPNLWERWLSPSQRQPVKRYFIYQCHHFKGGLRWIPSSKHDIRSR
jgi:undecaprenyl-diphosphatase